MSSVDTYAFKINLATAAKHTASKGAVAPARASAAIADRIHFSKAEIDRLNKSILKEMLHMTRLSVSNIERTGAKPYREGKGRFPGGIGRAVRNPRFGRADETGIYFADEEILNREAIHWRRLNFGTQGRATKARKFRLRFEGSPGESFGFEDGPRPAFSLPEGYFLHNQGQFVKPDPSFKGAGTNNPFVPLANVLGSVKRPARPGAGGGGTYGRGSSVNAEQRKKYESAMRQWRRTKEKRKKATGGGIGGRKTVGIKSRHFLDAGLAALEREFPRQYEDFLKDALLDAFESQPVVRVPTGPAPAARIQPRDSRGRFLPFPK